MNREPWRETQDIKNAIKVLFKNSSLRITDLMFYLINNSAAVGTEMLWNSSPCLDLYIASSQSQSLSIKSKEFMAENSTKWELYVLSQKTNKNNPVFKFCSFSS